jgi:GMP synthase (glutamine-hydrolysing)
MSFWSSSNNVSILPFPGQGGRLSAPLLPVLIVLHQETSTRAGSVMPARLGSLDIRRPRFGDALPETLDRHAGAVISAVR